VTPRDGGRTLCGFVALFLLGSLALAPPPAGANQDRLRVGGGSVGAPSGDWQREIAPDGDSVRFTRVHSWLGRPKGMTQILVFRNAVDASAGDEPGPIAADFLAGEERTMRELGVAAGEYELSDVERGSRTIGARSLYSLAYRKKLSLLRHGRKEEHAILYLWFPEDFPERREFYGFLISEIREKGSLVGSDDLGQIDPIIEGFRLERADRD